MGFDGDATFSGDKTRLQRRLNELSPHALFVHYRCHGLQVASMQAANATPGHQACLHYPDDVMEVLSLHLKMCRKFRKY